MACAFPIPSIRAPRVTASPRKLLALAVGHLLTGSAVFCADYAGNLLMATGSVDCASLGVLLLAGHFALLGVPVIRSAEQNLS